jgi:predicted nucleic acid-binding protein
MKRRVYVETSVVSYLTARRSRDIVVAGNQETTKEWWEARGKFELFISQFVLDEASAGDELASSERTRALSNISLLDVLPEAADLAEALLAKVALPAVAPLDALHIAVAAIHKMDFLVTWNCKHIANPAQRPIIESTIQVFGYEAPIICTPQELLEV